ncbi:MAG: membrane protein [Alphaproteobacteria bacterium]|nr:MAG: membrane protein [Alphaproteobacteria bacterium]
MTRFDIVFSPQLPLALVIAIAGLAGLLALYGLWRGLRGAWLRLAAAIILALALLNPTAVVEERDPLTTVVAVVSDRTGSQQIGGRAGQTEAIRRAVIERLSRLGLFDVREAFAEDQISATTDVSTALFRSLRSALQDVPTEQVGGAILITDGQVHDIPDSLASIGLAAPLHALITGEAGERDRRIVIEQAPRFGVVGEPFELSYRVRQTGFAADSPVAVGIYVDGELVATDSARPDEEMRFASTVPHGGKNIIELRAEVDAGEITEVNNRAFVTLNGIRENLRVLLISGEPHAGERTWRNLLKSDPSVDLVHFTILRPPEKQDGTPINQLSLIAFPTRELFVQKINEFDLIIFDRYRHRNVLPLLYFDNIVNYVREGGALLIAAGPELGEFGSIAEPLAALMPAQPDGGKIEAPFKPAVSPTGLRHPVTRDLDGWRQDEPQWGRWFRSVGVSAVEGQTVMTGQDDVPLLVLDHYGEGRVALFLSDHTWLWARGFEGGGPYVQLLRRTAHWLMKEPQLEEERLNADVEDGRLVIERQTLGDEPGEVVLTGPTGRESTVALRNAGPGVWRAEVAAPQFGLYSATDGNLRALVHVGPPNPREFAEVISTTRLLEPVLAENRGSVRRADGDDLPRIVPVRAGATASGLGWIGLENAEASVLKGISRLPLFAGLIGLALLLMALAATWAREGR